MKSYKYYLMLIVLLFGSKLVHGQIEAVPISYYGTWDRGGGVDDYADPKNDYIIGIEVMMNWDDVQLAPPTGDPAIDYDFSAFQNALQNAANHDKIVKLSINVGPDSPLWIYENGVPNVEMQEVLKPKWSNWPHYLNENYKSYYFELLNQFSIFLRTLPDNLFSRIAFVQVKTGATGDEDPYKGDPINLEYEIDDANWTAFRLEAYQIFKELFNDVDDRKIVLTFNAIDEDKFPTVRDWVFNTIDPEIGFGIKGGFGNRGHHLVGERSWAEKWTPYLVNPKGLKLFSASEMDQSWNMPIFNINTELGFYWSALGAMYSGLSSMNVSKTAILYAYDHEEIRDIFKMYNKYSKQVFPKTATTVVSVFHEGLDASNVEKFPESTYGNARRLNVERYKKIAEAYKDRGAAMGDTLVIKFGQVEQRRQQEDYNDVGWDIVEGNYERFLTQINPDSTSIALFRVRGKIDSLSSKYDRFARSFEHTANREKDTMYFKFHEDLFIQTQPKKLTFTVTWLDSIAGSTWALQYKNKAGSITQIQKTSIGDWQWKSEVFVIEDLMTGGVGTNGADFMLVNTDDKNDIFNGIEIDIERNPIPTISSVKDGDWSDPTTWDTGVVPTMNDNVLISHQVRVFSENNQANDVTINNPDGLLLINVQKSLTIHGNLVNNDAIRFNNNGIGQEMGTVILKGTYSGGNVTVNYKASLPNEDNWFLIGSPLQDVAISDFIANSSTIRKNASLENSIGFYNDSKPQGAKYTYFTDEAALEAGNFTYGKGYAALIDAPGGVESDNKFQFKGLFNTSDVAIKISDAGNGFNLLGNPYTTFLFANIDGNETDNILSYNASVLEENTLWLYESSTGAMLTKNLGDTGFEIAPIQGFFVKAKIGGGTDQNFRITEAMQTHNTSGSVFYKSAYNKRFQIDLKITEGQNSSSTSIRYIAGTTTDWDNGYDSSTFNGDANLEIATQLVTNNNGKNLAIQSLPNTAFETAVIPISIIADANKEITISAAIQNLPNGHYVFVEDREANKFTELNDNNPSFSFKPDTVVSGAGRFYLHTTSAVLNIDSEVVENVAIYTTDTSTLKIIGLQSGNTDVKIFSTLGKKVAETFFHSNGAKEIALSNLCRGIYIVQVNTKSKTIRKKVILEL
ncbi:T9SS type A sorting domain-containing protein [Polaribacter sp. Hel_I_88]|uniref:T9SS type A sorting domain-containing protein n=1 Tax=Polaribacter sp. Hel_I_88 TaxID=1250006 RepID=UPI000A4362BA|nr:T9SS type A sorting domain-containing protein [Polaribacter sp. Hel_I_88]